MSLVCGRIGKELVLAGLKPGSRSNAGFSMVNFGVNNLTATAWTDLANRWVICTSLSEWLCHTSLFYFSVLLVGMKNFAET